MPRKRMTSNTPAIVEPETDTVVTPETTPSTEGNPAIRMIDPEDVSINVDNQRKDYSTIASLIVKIVAAGRIFTPILLLGQVVFEGNRRVLAAMCIKYMKANPPKDLNAVINAIAKIVGHEQIFNFGDGFPLDFSGVDERLLAINITPEQAADELYLARLQYTAGTSAIALSPLERMAVIKEFKKQGQSAAKIAEITGESLTSIKRMLLVSKSSPELLAEISCGNIQDVVLAESIGAVARKLGKPESEVLDNLRLHANGDKLSRSHLDAYFVQCQTPDDQKPKKEKKVKETMSRGDAEVNIRELLASLTALDLSKLSNADVGLLGDRCFRLDELIVKLEPMPAAGSEPTIPFDEAGAVETQVEAPADFDEVVEYNDEPVQIIES